jgi:hypothetical protein
MRSMRLLVGLAFSAGAILIATPVAATAAPPTHLRVPFTLAVPSPEYSAACGFEVLVSVDTVIDVTLNTMADGSVREIDTYPDLRIVVSAPSTGRSLEHVFGPTTYDYPDGLYLGAPAVITSLGVRGDAPAIPADAGRVVTPGAVVAFDPDLGFPIAVPTGPPISQSGNFEDPVTIVAAICAALAG